MPDELNFLSPIFALNNQSTALALLAKGSLTATIKISNTRKIHYVFTLFNFYLCSPAKKILPTASHRSKKLNIKNSHRSYRKSNSYKRIYTNMDYIKKSHKTIAICRVKCYNV
jgi:hypothetical protein